MIPQEDFNQGYFGGVHPAGYTTYERRYIEDADDRTDQAEILKTSHFKLFTQFKSSLLGKKCLDIGCTKGFLVEDFREWGVDCYGVDWSQYAVSQSNVPQFIAISNAYLYLQELPSGSFDVATLIRFMPCLDDAIIPDFLTELHRVSKYQIYVVDNQEYYPQQSLPLVSQYYNIKTLAEWETLLGTPHSHVESITDSKWDDYR